MTEAEMYATMTEAALEKLEKRIVATRRWFYGFSLSRTSPASVSP
jgi:hypothetical protein